MLKSCLSLSKDYKEVLSSTIDHLWLTMRLILITSAKTKYLYIHSLQKWFFKFLLAVVISVKYLLKSKVKFYSWRKKSQSITFSTTITLENMSTSWDRIWWEWNWRMLLCRVGPTSKKGLSLPHFKIWLIRSLKSRGKTKRRAKTMLNWRSRKSSNWRKVKTSVNDLKENNSRKKTKLRLLTLRFINSTISMTRLLELRDGWRISRKSLTLWNIKWLVCSLNAKKRKKRSGTNSSQADKLTSLVETFISFLQSEIYYFIFL